MSLGPVIFGVALGVIAGIVVLQWRMARTTRAREGTPVGALPPPFDATAGEHALWWFHSPTCAPCRAMRGDVDAFATEGRLHAVDVTQHLDVAAAFSVMATPTTVAVRDGHIVAVRVGRLTRAELETLASA